MLDGITSRGQVIVIGATNRPDSIDSALRRPGRFDREIEIGVPSEEDRLEILKIHTRNMPLEGSAAFHAVQHPTDRTVQKYENSRERLLASLASASRGFVGADLAALAREAAVIALRRQVDSECLENEKIPDEILKSLEVTKADFISAMHEITPSAMREIALETADVSWTDVGGCGNALADVRESVEYPLTRKEKFAALGIRPPKGVLLYGPPGTGKTLIAKAVAHESGANFIAIKGPQLLSKWVGESERAVRDLFKKARQVAPSVLFFDEIDSLTPSRGGGEGGRVLENVLNQILAEMDGIEELNDVVVLAASNRPDIIDPALLRSGRFDRLVYIAEPSVEDRKAILAVHTRTMPIEGSVMDELLEGLSGIAEADIEALSKKLSGREVTVKQVLASAKKFPRDSETPFFELRRLVASLFAKECVNVKDAAREKLLDKLASETEGYVGSDLEGLCREAAMLALRRGADFVSPSDFEAAKSSVHPTMNPRVREYYEGIRQRFKGGLQKEVQNFIEYQ
jgi:transitional endoplasmic reticulum ATPase